MLVLELHMQGLKEKNSRILHVYTRTCLDLSGVNLDFLS